MALLKCSLSLLFTVLICCSLQQPCFARPIYSVKVAVKNLSNVLTQLVTERDTAVDIMKLFRKSKGLYFEHKPCDLATDSMYKYVTLKKYTLTGHLGRIFMLLKPIWEATNARDWGDDIKSIHVKSTLKEVAFGILKPIFWLRVADPLLNKKFPPAVTYNSTLLTEEVQEYLKCVGIPGNKSAERILTYATVIKSLDLAISAMAKDMNYIKHY